MAHEGSFEGARGFYDYEVIDWRHLNSPDEVKDGDSLTDRNTHNVHEVTIRIEHTESKITSYETIRGPFDDWDFVEDVLEYDYGEEGSRKE